MAYQKLNLVDGQTVVNKALIQHLEDGIVVAEQSGGSGTTPDLSKYYTKTESDTKYQTKTDASSQHTTINNKFGNYYTKTELDTGLEEAFTGVYGAFEELGAGFQDHTERITALEQSGGGGGSAYNFPVISLANGSDLDTYITPGWYGAPNGLTLYNLPYNFEDWGQSLLIMEVQAIDNKGTCARQTIYDPESKTSRWIRYRYEDDGTWGAWKRLDIIDPYNYISWNGWESIDDDADNTVAWWYITEYEDDERVDLFLDAHWIDADYLIDWDASTFDYDNNWADVQFEIPLPGWIGEGSASVELSDYDSSWEIGEVYFDEDEITEESWLKFWVYFDEVPAYDDLEQLHIIIHGCYQY